jgi:hypothetical protein
MPDGSLTDKVCSKLLTGALPRVDPTRVYAGYGRGEPCMACDAPVLTDQIVYEVEMPDGVKLPMHLGCHGLWVVERIRRGWSTGLEHPGQVTAND